MLFRFVPKINGALDARSDAIAGGIKRAEDGDGVIVRVYNTSNEAADGAIDVLPLRGGVSMVNLNEEHIADVPRVSGEVLLSARTNEIVTLRFRR